MKALMHTKKFYAVLGLGGLIVGLWMSSILQAQTSGQGTIITVDGVVDVQKAGSTRWVPAVIGMEISPGDTIRTTVGSIADVELQDGTALRVDEESELKIESLAEETKKARFLFFLDRDVRAKQAKLNLAQGRVMASVKKLPNSQSSFRVETPKGVAGVRGTSWFVGTTDDLAGVRQGGATYWPREQTASNPFDSLLDWVSSVVSGDRRPDDPEGHGTYIPEGFTLGGDGAIATMSASDIENLVGFEADLVGPENVPPDNASRDAQQYVREEVIGRGGLGSERSGRGVSAGGAPLVEDRAGDAAAELVDTGGSGGGQN
jgi:hypothetical protein